MASGREDAYLWMDARRTLYGSPSRSYSEHSFVLAGATRRSADTVGKCFLFWKCYISSKVTQDHQHSCTYVVLERVLQGVQRQHDMDANLVGLQLFHGHSISAHFESLQCVRAFTIAQLQHNEARSLVM